ncbi:hypothetical protein E2C01_050881 [Portunus trituberculatus]|uniref:Uncharacterized protein n=1 Tax=Portunus trituberculatus TaxID=210409 RepID=A0A5B7GHI8_PORTR|nr:hypothetical protein [Portunus trituberculatus]
MKSSHRELEIQKQVGISRVYQRKVRKLAKRKG